MIVRELVSKLGFKADNKAAERHESALRRVRRAATALTAAYAATVGALTAVAAGMARTGNELAKSAQESAMAADKFQRVSFALSQISRTSQRETDRALGRITQRIGRAAREGGQYADALMEMGFSQQQVAEGMIGTGDVVDALADQIRNARNEQEASAIAGDMLGTRIGRTLGPALFRNADAFREAQKRAEELGGGWSSLALDASEELTDSFGDVSMITSTLTSTIAERLVPAVNSAVSAFVDWWIANRELILQNVRHYLDLLSTAARAVHRVVSGVVGIVNEAVQSLGGWERTIRLVLSAIAALIAVKLAAWLWGVAGALAAAAASGRLLRTILLGISRIPIIALFVALGVAIEDLVVWINGGNSAIGALIGSFEDFRVAASNTIQQVIAMFRPLLDVAGALGGILIASLTLNVSDVMAGFKRLGQAINQWAINIGRTIHNALMNAIPAPIRGAAGLAGDALGSAADWASGAIGGVFGGRDPADDTQRTSTGRIQVNARTEATLQVPDGTPEEQRAAIESQARQIFEEHWDREINRSLNDMPVTE